MRWSFPSFPSLSPPSTRSCDCTSCTSSTTLYTPTPSRFFPRPLSLPSSKWTGWLIVSTPWRNRLP